jgi:hypothetical protein
VLTLAAHHHHHHHRRRRRLQSLDIGRQTWFARDVNTKAWVSDLKDGVKYLLGTKWLPTGWEVG